ncbi:unnamed protein product [Lepidochelys olivacea]
MKQLLEWNAVAVYPAHGSTTQFRTGSEEYMKLKLRQDFRQPLALKSRQPCGKWKGEEQMSARTEVSHFSRTGLKILLDCYTQPESELFLTRGRSTHATAVRDASCNHKMDFHSAMDEGDMK